MRERGLDLAGESELERRLLEVRATPDKDAAQPVDAREELTSIDGVADIAAFFQNEIRYRLADERSLADARPNEDPGRRAQVLAADPAALALRVDGEHPGVRGGLPRGPPQDPRGPRAGWGRMRA